jgi:polyketide synthase PksN
MDEHPIIIGARQEPSGGDLQTADLGLSSQPLYVPTASAPQLEEELIRSLAKALYMEESEVDVERPFVEMGLDSVVSVEWIRSLNKQYASNLTATRVYDYPTVRQLAGFLAKEFLKHKGVTQQMSVPSLSTLSQDDILQQVQQGVLDIEKAEKLLHQLSSLIS